jgi:hypothetical protein
MDNWGSDTLAGYHLPAYASCLLNDAVGVIVEELGTVYIFRNKLKYLPSLQHKARV